MEETNLNRSFNCSSSAETQREGRRAHSLCHKCSRANRARPRQRSTYGEFSMTGCLLGAARDVSKARPPYNLICVCGWCSPLHKAFLMRRSQRAGGSAADVPSLRQIRAAQLGDLVRAAFTKGNIMGRSMSVEHGPSARQQRKQ